MDRAEAALDDVCYRNEAQLRLMLAHSLKLGLAGGDGRDVPTRQNRRTAWIEAALSPARSRLDMSTYATLCAAPALIFGPESMVVFTDVLGMGHGEARAVKGWAIRALVRAALEEAKTRSRSRQSRR